jgi:hypothetical protein
MFGRHAGADQRVPERPPKWDGDALGDPALA